MSTRSNQEALKATAGLTTNQAVVKSGADLMQAANVAAAATTVGPGKDGARIEQMKGGGTD